MKNFFLALSGSFAAIPGVAIMVKGIGTPPGYAFMFGGIIEAFGSLALILLWLHRDKIQRIKPRRITKVSIILASVSFLSLVLYIVLFKLCVVSHPTHHTVLFPLWTSGELAKLVSAAGGRWAALDEFGWFGVYGAVEKMPSYAVPVTVAALLVCYQSVFTTLTIAFGLPGFHQQKQIEPEANKRLPKKTSKTKR
ncbi:MAG TPA: hypothetical protein VJU86_08480 [Pyrinomonadaceae bacterium]|nr:hypothetical protein [Pyrinomonadaceae bacterium]